MQLTVKSPKVSEALLIWFFETWYAEVQRVHEKGPLHVPSAEARVLPALLQIEEKEMRFQVMSNIVPGSNDEEVRLLTTLRPPPLACGFCPGGEMTPTYAWAFHVNRRDRVLMQGGTMLPVRVRQESDVMQSPICKTLPLTFLERFDERMNDACKRTADAEPEPRFAGMPSLLDFEADGNDYHVLSNLRVGTDIDRLRFLNILRRPPKAMGRWSGETQHEKVWVLYGIPPYDVLIICRKIITRSTAYYRNGGGGGGR